jgi:hypothetical protein
MRRPAHLGNANVYCANAEATGEDGSDGAAAGHVVAHDKCLARDAAAHRHLLEERRSNAIGRVPLVLVVLEHQASARRGLHRMTRGRVRATRQHACSQSAPVEARLVVRLVTVAVVGVQAVRHVRGDEE